MSLADHFDMDALALLRDIMDDEFAELINVYLDDSAQRLQQMQDALRNDDAALLRELSHSFKGASSNVSALPLAALLQQLEDAGLENRLDGAEDLLRRVEQEFSAVSSHLLAQIA